MLDDEIDGTMTSDEVFGRFPFHARKVESGRYMVDAHGLARDVALILFACGTTPVEFIKEVMNFEVDHKRVEH